MKCKFCDGSGKDYWCLNGEPYPCPVCNGTGEYEPFDADIELDKLDSEPQTNEEWFDNLSTEEKARFFSYKMRCEFCPNQEQCDSLGANCKVLWELWLKQPHKE